jgi:transcriptional regulator with XRE-family HTH domain
MWQRMSTPRSTSTLGRRPPVIDRGDVAKRLKAIRKARGWSQGRVAQLAGLKKGAVSKLETARPDRPVALDTIEKVADALGAPLFLAVRRPSTGHVPDRFEVQSRVNDLLKRMKDDEVETILHEVDLWESKYPPEGV